MQKTKKTMSKEDSFRTDDSPQSNQNYLYGLAGGNDSETASTLNK
jgi:hypothetical protein